MRGPLYVEEAFGIVGDGVADDTVAWAAAAASGLSLRMREGARYRLTNSIRIDNGTRLLGDGSQLFRQVSSNLGVFIVGDGVELENIDTEYALPRAVDIVSISQSCPAVISTGKAHGLKTGDLVRLTGIGSMIEANHKSLYVSVLGPTSCELYVNLAFPNQPTTPFDSRMFTPYDPSEPGGFLACNPPSWQGLSGFQRNAGLWCEGSDITVTNFGARGFFNVCTLRGPLSSWRQSIRRISQDDPGVLEIPEHGLQTGSAIRIPNPGGMTQLAGFAGRVVKLDDDHVSLIFGGLPVNTSRFDDFTGGGIATGYDFSSQSNGISLKNLRGARCDFGLTASCYKQIVVDRMQFSAPTYHTVPPHIIYLRSAEPPHSRYEGFCEAGTIKDIEAEGYRFSEALKFCNTKDFLAENIRLKDCSAGITWSRAFRSKTIDVDIQGVPFAQYGIRYTADGADNEIIGGTISGAPDAAFNGVVANHDNKDIRTIGTNIKTNFSSVKGRTIRQFKTTHSAEMTCEECTIVHERLNDAFSFGALHRSKITVKKPTVRGNKRLLNVRAGATAILQVDPGRLEPGWDQARKEWVVGRGTVRMAD